MCLFVCCVYFKLLYVLLFQLVQKYESTVKMWGNLEECSDIPFLYEWIWCTRVLVLFILDDTLDISANNKWSDETAKTDQTVIYCGYGFCE